MGKGRWLQAALVLAVIALVAAGCDGDDDDEGTTEPTGGDAAALQEEISDLSDEEQVERIGQAWVEPFAAGEEAMCAYLHPDLGADGATCTLYADGHLARSRIHQGSFAGATVAKVDVKDQTAMARFNNGSAVEFQQDPEGDWWVVDPSETAGR